MSALFRSLAEKNKNPYVEAGRSQRYIDRQPAGILGSPKLPYTFTKMSSDPMDDRFTSQSLPDRRNMIYEPGVYHPNETIPDREKVTQLPDVRGYDETSKKSYWHKRQLPARANYDEEWKWQHLKQEKRNLQNLKSEEMLLDPKVPETQKKLLRDIIKHRRYKATA